MRKLRMAIRFSSVQSLHSPPLHGTPFVEGRGGEGEGEEEEKEKGEKERKRGSFNLYLEQSTNCRRNSSKCAKLQKMNKLWPLAQLRP